MAADVARQDPGPCPLHKLAFRVFFPLVLDGFRGTGRAPPFRCYDDSDISVPE
ncbi:unnamed protein product [Ixodes persulcatus]